MAARFEVWTEARFSNLPKVLAQTGVISRKVGRSAQFTLMYCSNPAAQDGADLGDTIGELQMLLSD